MPPYIIPISINLIIFLMASVTEEILLKKMRFFIYFIVISAVGLAILIFNGNFSDWYFYSLHVESCSSIGCTYFEPIFDLIIFLCAYLGGFEYLKLAVFFSYLATSIILINFVEPEQKILACLAISVGMLSMLMGGMRQAMSISFLIYSIKSLTDSKYIKFIVFTGVAGLIHSSCFLISSLFVFGWYIKEKKILWIIISTFIVFLIIYQTMNQFAILGDDNTSEFAAKVGRTSSDSVYYDSSGAYKDIFIIIERLVGCFLLILLYNINLSKIDKVSIICYFMGSLFFLISMDIDRNIAGRTLSFFRIFDPFSYYYIINEVVIKIGLKRNRQIIVWPIVAVIIMGRSYISMSSAGFYND